MTALNMLVRNADATIVHGNTLSMETFGGYVTRRSAFGGEIRALTAAQASTVLTATAQIQAEHHREPSVEPAAPTPSAPPLEMSSQPFKVDRKGQFGFDF